MKAGARKKLIELLGTADEAFLVAIANKGLVRRAYKDLEECTLSVEETDFEMIVKGPDWTVWMPPEGPTKAHDSTKASGITRQIIAATIHLRDQWLPSESTEGIELSTLDSQENAKIGFSEHNSEQVADLGKSEDKRPQSGTIKQALVDLNLETLIKWAGKRLLEEALEQSECVLDLEIDEALGLILSSSEHEMEVRILPTNRKGSGLLEEIISTAPKALHKRWVLAAVLALKRMEGKAIELPGVRKLDKIESPRNRTQVLHDTSKALTGMLLTGIAHPSKRNVERIATLSMSASAVHLPRLAHLLRSLAEEVSLLIERNTNADTQRLFTSMCHIAALVKGLKSAAPDVPIELAGNARSQYKRIGTLSLTGIGAYPWQTNSGYSGLTLLFWNADKQRFFSWSASRPAHSARGFSESQVYRLEAPWSGSKSCEALSKSSFTLSNAFANSQDRLSSSGETKAVSNDSNVAACKIDFGEKLFGDWYTLAKYAASQFPTGLKVLHSLDRIVVIEPKAWGERYYDEMQQALCWNLEDDSGMPLLMTLPWNEYNESAIHFFESLKPKIQKARRLVARITFSGSGFAIVPISVICDDINDANCILNPSFDHELIESKHSNLLSNLKQKFKRDTIKIQMTGDNEWDEVLHISSISQSVPSAIRNKLAETEALLLRIAESGISGWIVKDDHILKELTENLIKCGLTELAKSLNEVSSSESASENVLWSGYLCNLHWQILVQQSLH